MVPVGYEPDLYVHEGTKKFRGTVEQYKAMYRHFIEVFEQEGVDNVVWVMDYSYEIRHDLDAAVNLWPGPEVSWLFFNVFQFTNDGPGWEGTGDCPAGLSHIYHGLQDRIPQVPEWENIPWGLGAWGSNDKVWKKTVIPQEDREHCILGVQEQLESEEFNRLRAQIYFNSLSSRIDEERTPEMLPTLDSLHSSKVFYPEDENKFTFEKKWTCENKGGLCGNSCDSRCAMSYPINDPLKTLSDQAACRCDPKGHEFDGVDVPSWTGWCRNCKEDWEGTC
jgi:hypothetical protein